MLNISGRRKVQGGVFVTWHYVTGYTKSQTEHVSCLPFRFEATWLKLLNLSFRFFYLEVRTKKMSSGLRFRRPSQAATLLLVFISIISIANGNIFTFNNVKVCRASRDLSYCDEIIFPQHDLIYAFPRFPQALTTSPIPPCSPSTIRLPL